MMGRGFGWDYPPGVTGNEPQIAGWPEKPRKAQTPRPLEKDVQKAILDYLKMSGIYAWKAKSQGTYDPKRGIWRKGETLAGVSDILAIVPPEGTLIAIEVKRDEKEKPTADQIKFIEAVNSRGGMAFVAWSVKQVAEKLKAWP